MSSIWDRFEWESVKRMLNNAREVHKYSGKPTLFILLDMASCILKDHVGCMEYNLFHFVGKSKKDRATYITFDDSQKLFKMLNDREYIPLFNDKLSFNKIFSSCLGRGFLDLTQASEEDFVSFCQGKETIFAKPADSCSGKGIYRNFKVNEDADLHELYEYLRSEKLYVEDTILQHLEMSRLNPTSINTVRVTTVLDKDNVPHVMYAILRIGIEGMSVDNVGSGGIYTVLSKDGVIDHPCWSDKTISTYVNHPSSGMKLTGFQIPYFEEALELCKNAAKVEPHVRYVGWDIAITEDGPVIVEGNPLPGYDMPQNYFVTGKDTGLKPEFEKVLGEKL